MSIYQLVALYRGTLCGFCVFSYKNHVCLNLFLKETEIQNVRLFSN